LVLPDIFQPGFKAGFLKGRIFSLDIWIQKKSEVDWYQILFGFPRIKEQFFSLDLDQD